MNSKQNRYEKNDYIYIVVPQNVYIRHLRISGPIVSPIKVRVSVAYEIACCGIKVYEYNPSLKKYARLTVQNAYNKDKFNLSSSESTTESNDSEETKNRNFSPSPDAMTSTVESDNTVNGVSNDLIKDASIDNSNVVTAVVSEGDKVDKNQSDTDNMHKDADIADCMDGESSDAMTSTVESDNTVNGVTDTYTNHDGRYNNKKKRK